MNAQTVFWTENFNNGCSANCLANGYTSANGTWNNTDLGTAPGNGDEPNVWYISCAENGHTNNVCGTGCVASSATATLASLHVGASPGTYGDLGAAYDAGGVCGFFWCINTHKRIQSPNISTIGYTGIRINFDYIEYGEGTNDDMYALQYSTNGGTSWTTLVNPGKTTCCSGTGACSGSDQGRWTAFTSATLPVAAEGISNLRVAFVWRNNDDGVGTDPSFAVDNLTLTCTGGASCGSLPVELVEFDVKSTENGRYAFWSTASETNADRFVLERSVDGTYFNPVAIIPAKGNSSEMTDYFFNDTEEITDTKIIYYRLAQIDLNGDVKRYPIVAIENSASLSEQFSIIRNANLLELIFPSQPETDFCIEIFSITGNIISKNCFEESEGDRVLINTEGLSSGLYLVRFMDSYGRIQTGRVFLN